MQEKEGVSELIGNFEINSNENKVIVFVNPKIFPVSAVNKAASFFGESAWVSVEGDPKEELVIEIKPKVNKDLELLGREFNNKLLEMSTNDIQIDNDNPALISKLKQVVKQFISEEKGSISKQSIITLGAILGGIGLGSLVIEDASASHFCSNCSGGDCCDGGGGLTTECSPGVETCFIAGTMITLNNSIQKPIQEVVPGDKLVGKEKINVVRKVFTPKLGNRKLYGINEGEAFVTGAHPFLTKDGWKSIEPSETKKGHPNLVVGALAIGDTVLTKDGGQKINSITSMDGDAAQTIYNLYLSGDHTYMANKFIVHNKTCFIAGTKVKLEDGTIKNIESVKAGERLIGTNNKANTVLRLDRTVLGQRKLISFNKGPFFITPEHPIMTKDGWKSLDPAETEKENPDLRGLVSKLKIGDKLTAIPKFVENNGQLMMLNQETELASIDEKEERNSLILYNFIIDGDHSFNADGFIVHNHIGTGPGPGGTGDDSGGGGGGGDSGCCEACCDCSF